MINQRTENLLNDSEDKFFFNERELKLALVFKDGNYKPYYSGNRDLWIC